jgi:hypothetical protein
MGSSSQLVNFDKRANSTFQNNNLPRFTGPPPPPKQTKVELEEKQLKERLAEIEAEKEAAIKQVEAVKETEKQAAKEKILELSVEAKTLRKRIFTAREAKNEADEKLYRGALIDTEEAIVELREKYEIFDKVIDSALGASSGSEADDKIKFLGISTTKAVAITTGMVSVIGFLFWRLCVSEMVVNPNNDGVLRMLNTSGLRIMLNFLYVCLSILTSFVFIYLFLHDLWVWLHNRIESEFSLKNDLEQCTPSQRLHFFTLNFWLPAFLFALCLIAIVG